MDDRSKHVRSDEGDPARGIERGSGESLKLREVALWFLDLFSIALVTIVVCFVTTGGVSGAWEHDLVVMTAACVCAMIAVLVVIAGSRGIRHRKAIVGLACGGLAIAGLGELVAASNESWRRCRVADELARRVCERARRVGEALEEYACNNEGRLPTNLLRLVEEGQVRSEDLWIQSDTPGACDYAYVRGLRVDADPPDWIAAFARQDQFYGKAGLVLFLGGEVWYVPREELERVLSAFFDKYVKMRGRQPAIVEPRSDNR